MGATRVLGIGHIVALMAPWSKPAYLTRVWCDFEMFKAIQAGKDCKITITMPRKEADGMRDALCNKGLDGLWKTLKGIKIENAQASVEDDKVQIMKLIEEQIPGGASTINKKVAQRLQEWIISTCETFLKDGAEKNVGKSGEER